MEGWDVPIVAAVILAYALGSRRLARAAITPAIVFVTLGFVLGESGFDVLSTDFETSTLRLLAEVTLALVLFTDASGLNTKALRAESGMPVRLLGIGLPLTIVLGTIAAALLFTDLGVAAALILAVLLAPTDAALGQAVVADERLPSRLRQGLNVEAGLNDGICVPLLFAAIAFAEIDGMPSFDGQVLIDLVSEVGIALVAGVVVSAVTVLVARRSLQRSWMDEEWTVIVPLATTAIAYGSAVALHASGFIAAFVAGLVYGRMLGERAHATVVLDEEIGQLLSAITFFVFAAGALDTITDGLEVTSVVYAVLSLTILRMVPVALSLLRSNATWQTMLFAGWFGPRGLASIVFMLIVVEDANVAGTDRIIEVGTLTVVLSVFAHGFTAIPLTNRYVRWFSSRRDALEYEGRTVPVTARPRGLAARRHHRDHTPIASDPRR